MAAERRVEKTTFAHSPLISTSQNTQRYNRFNFKDHMKQHMIKVSDPGYMKRVLAFNNAAQDNAEAEEEEQAGGTATQAEAEQQDNAERQGRGSTPSTHRTATPKRTPFLSTAMKKEWHKTRREKSAGDVPGEG